MKVNEWVEVPLPKQGVYPVFVTGGTCDDAGLEDLRIVNAGQAWRTQSGEKI